MDAYLPSTGGTFTGDLTIHGSANVNGNDVLDKGKYFAYKGSVSGSTVNAAHSTGYIEVSPGIQGFIISAGQEGHNGITIFRSTSTTSSRTTYNISFQTSTATNLIGITASPGTVSASTVVKAKLTFTNRNVSNSCYFYGTVLSNSGSISSIIYS